jgi:DNA polymerase III alpha subunit (gram-positive type)
MNMSYSIYVFDCETTGLDPQLNDIIEISFLRLSDGEQKTWCMKPLNVLEISDGALKVNGHKREDILWQTPIGRETYKEPKDIVPEIEAWIISDGSPIEDRVLVGQNVRFDYDFSKELWAKTEAADSFPFKDFLIDTMQIARFIDLCTEKKRTRYNLGSLVKDFGITKTKAHRAEGDVKMTKDLFLAQFNPIKEFLAKTFSDKYTE